MVARLSGAHLSRRVLPSRLAKRAPFRWAGRDVRFSHRRRAAARLAAHRLRSEPGRAAGASASRHVWHAHAPAVVAAPLPAGAAHLGQRQRQRAALRRRAGGDDRGAEAGADRCRKPRGEGVAALRRRARRSVDDGAPGHRPWGRPGCERRAGLRRPAGMRPLPARAKRPAAPRARALAGERDALPAFLRPHTAPRRADRPSAAGAPRTMLWSEAVHRALSLAARARHAW